MEGRAFSPRQLLNGQRVLRTYSSRQNKVRKDPLRLATVNISALSGRSREVVDMFERKREDIGCLQDVRYRGQRSNEKDKFWWSRLKKGSNRVGIMVKEDLVEEMIDKRLDDRMMKNRLFRIMLRNRVDLKKKRGSFLINYLIIYMMSLKRGFRWWQVI